MKDGAKIYHSRIVRDGRVEFLPELLGFVEGVCRAVGLDEDGAFEFRLAVEEICANIIEHGYGEDAEGPIQLDFRWADGALVLTITDEAPTFSPADAPEPDLDADWEDRPIGGLGWHLTRSVMDEVRHEPGRNGGNRITLIKHSTQWDES